MRGQDVELSRFESPRWDAPFDVEGEIAAAPPEGTVRGMFFDFLIDRVRGLTGQRIDETSRIAFGKYPMREYLRLLVRTATPPCRGARACAGSGSRSSRTSTRP